MEGQLRLLEEQFTADLIATLRDCATGRWGIFGHNEILKSQEAEVLLGQGEEIVQLRRQLGEADDFQPYQRLLYYRQWRSSNAPGEPKLALEFLRELGLQK
jgi:hypothetical protein